VSFRVRLTRDAAADLDRQFDFVLERALARDGGDLTLPEQAIVALRAGLVTLKTSPFTCRKAGRSSFVRELIIPFERSGYVALFEIEDESNVAVVAVPTNSRMTTTDPRRLLGDDAFLLEATRRPS